MSVLRVGPPSMEAQQLGDEYGVALEMMLQQNRGKPAKNDVHYIGPQKGGSLCMRQGQLLSENVGRLLLRRLMGIGIGGLFASAAGWFASQAVTIMGVLFSVAYGSLMVISDLARYDDDYRTTLVKDLIYRGLGISVVGIIILGPLSTMVHVGDPFWAIFTMEGAGLSGGILGWMAYLWLPRRYDRVEMAPGHLALMKKKIRELGREFSVDVSRLFEGKV